MTEKESKKEKEEGEEDEEGFSSNRMGGDKFSMAEILFGSLFLLAIDGIAALLDSTGIGYFLATVLQAAGSFATTIWISSKGGDRAWAMERQLKKHISNFLPVIPTLTFVFLVEAYFHNHPTAKKVASASLSDK